MSMANGLGFIIKRSSRNIATFPMILLISNVILELGTKILAVNKFANDLLNARCHPSSMASSVRTPLILGTGAPF